MKPPLIISKTEILQEEVCVVIQFVFEFSNVIRNSFHFHKYKFNEFHATCTQHVSTKAYWFSCVRRLFIISFQ